MSPHSVSNFVGDLVEMAKAYEELPQVQRQLSDLETINHRQSETIAHREESILKLKAEIEALHARIRTTEAERDDAEYRFLEADERTNRALDFIKATFGNAGSLIQALEPPKPQPEPKPITTASPDATHVEISEGNAEVRAIDNPLYGDPDHHPEPSFHGSPANPDSVSVGQSAVDPTSLRTEQSSSSGTESDGSGSNSDLGPYHGKRYIDVPGWVSRQDWLAGGGTNESYDARG